MDFLYINILFFVFFIMDILDNTTVWFLFCLFVLFSFYMENLGHLLMGKIAATNWYKL